MLGGFVLLVIGVLVPFAMVLQIMEPNLLVSFLGYAASLVGLVIGVLGVVTYTRSP